MEDEARYHYRRSMETVRAAAEQLNSASTVNADPTVTEHNEYLSELQTLLRAVAHRLKDEGVDWDDLDYLAKTLDYSDLDPEEKLEHILTTVITPGYLHARKQLKRQTDVLELALHSNSAVLSSGSWDETAPDQVY